VGDYKCYGNHTVANEVVVETYTAVCLTHTATPIAIVDLWVVDDLVGMNATNFPNCCHPPEDLCTPTVQLTFKVYCECPLEAVDRHQRLLRGGGEK
jgi:hypothetical protein